MEMLIADWECFFSKKYSLSFKFTTLVYTTYTEKIQNKNYETEGGVLIKKN